MFEVVVTFTVPPAFTWISWGHLHKALG